MEREKNGISRQNELKISATVSLCPVLVEETREKGSIVKQEEMGEFYKTQV
jgi:hypothetical protein